MSTLDRARLNTIRGRLWLGFGVLVALLVVAGVVARRSFTGMSTTIKQSLAEVQAEAQLASALSANVAKTIEAGSRYLETRDSAAQDAFRKFGWAAHDVQRRDERPPGPDRDRGRRPSPTIDNKLSCDGSRLRARASAGRPRSHGRRAQSGRASARRRSTICSTTSSDSAS